MEKPDSSDANTFGMNYNRDCELAYISELKNVLPTD